MDSCTTLVSTETLAVRLDDPRWVVVDTRYVLKDELAGAAMYRTSHVPGAVYASLSHDLAGPRTGTNGRHPLPAPSVLAATFGRLGIGPGTQVVCYDADSGMFAARLWWMLRYMGHDSVAVLDGGFAKWGREGRPTRSGDERRAATAFTARVNAGMVASLDEVRASLDDGVTRLVDARSAERFEGVHEPLDRTPGHIPGAVNYHYQRNVNADGTFLPVEELRNQLNDALAGTSPDRVTMYCGSGVTACQNLLAMQHAGLAGAKLYVGSWSEWSAYPERPVEQGPARDRESG
ncbi:MAG: sulfurtransferase [Acidimicrobiia bacterium]|nr:sulfurtransferase [Acidimicrobiia bacterium]